MTFDPTSLLQAPPAPPPEQMTVATLAARLAQLSAMGFGGVGLALPDGLPINVVDLVAEGETAAHFILRSKFSAKNDR